MLPSKEFKELDRCWPLIHAAMACDVVPDTHNISDIWEMMKSGEAQLWSTDASAVLTNVIMFPRKPPLLNIWLSGGKIKEVLRLIDQAEAWARQGNFTHMVGCGRREWGRAYGKRGAKEQHTVFSKELI